MKKIFTDEGLEEIQSMGKPFDPDLHEAVGVEKTDKNRENLVLEEWQKGYQCLDFGECKNHGTGIHASPCSFR